ncbi:hypothetical protein NON20_12200 [Synechocystis sp. B12]|nr:hypothetical protein NON20_12200 [Synechocystis sp. B12]
MASEYERIQKRATEDPGTAGDQGEENWATLLRDWLPATYEVVTKGRIISHEGKMSPQIDILVLKDSYPRKLLDKKIYLAAGVAAAFECKVTLIASYIKEAIENCVKVKSLFQPRTGTPYKELHAPIIYGLLAHSHSWKGEKSTPIENIKTKLIIEDQNHVDHPRKMLDLLCVADLAAWSSCISTFVGPGQIADWDQMAKLYGLNGSATTAYIGHSSSDINQVKHFTPVGVLISYLSQKLAWEHPEYRSLADYYRVTNISGSGSGSMRKWEATIYSNGIRSRVQKGQLSNGIFWDEWSVHFS